MDKTVKKIEDLFEPQPGETTGFITADDLKNAFKMMAQIVDDSRILGEEDVVGVLQKTSGQNGDHLVEVLDRLRHVLAKWDLTLQAGQAATVQFEDEVTGLMPIVTGEAQPTTVAQTASLLNNLIQALVNAGFVLDLRPQPQAPVNAGAPLPNALIQPTAPNNMWTWTGDPGFKVPDTLTELKGLPLVGDADYVNTQATAYPADQFAVLSSGKAVWWTGTEWVFYQPVFTSLVPPNRAAGNKEWHFAPANGRPDSKVSGDDWGLADLKTDGNVGDTALQDRITNQGPNQPVPYVFTTGEFITLPDGTTAHFGVDPTLGANDVTDYVWQKGAAP